MTKQDLKQLKRIARDIPYSYHGTPKIKYVDKKGLKELGGQSKLMKSEGVIDVSIVSEKNEYFYSLYDHAENILESRESVATALAESNTGKKLLIYRIVYYDEMQLVNHVRRLKNAFLKAETKGVQEYVDHTSELALQSVMPICLGGIMTKSY